nr:LOW QUALITY PROTEIN: inactive polyglycylase TTLL10 [Loxodonta africana]
MGQGQGAGPQAALRPRRRVGPESAQRGPRPGAPIPIAHGRTRFIHHRGPPTRAQAATKRSKRTRVVVVRRGHPRAPGEYKSAHAGVPLPQGRPPGSRWSCSHTLLHPARSNSHAWSLPMRGASWVGRGGWPAKQDGGCTAPACPQPCPEPLLPHSPSSMLTHGSLPDKEHLHLQMGWWGDAQEVLGMVEAWAAGPCGHLRPWADPTLSSGWAHQRSMGSGPEEGLLRQLSQLDHDAGEQGLRARSWGRGEPPQGRTHPLTAHCPQSSEDADATRPLAARLEEQLLEGEKQLPSAGQGPFFYIGGTNGASIISAYCRSKGWHRTQDSRREDYKLKWCEVKCRDTYCSFREGEQLLYQLPNNKLLTTKIGLLSALREYSRVVNKINKTSQSNQAKAAGANSPVLLGQAGRGQTHILLTSLLPRILRMEEFFPETYRLDIRDEREAFFALFDETQTWICKPTASNQGKGIFLLRNQEEVAALQAKTQSIEDDPVYRKMPFRAPQARVVQRYIRNPLLLDGKKFDVRSYLLIACAMPYMVFFGHGYARLTLGLYDPHSNDLSGHLTNQFMQKKSPLYVLLKEDTVWSMEHLNRYINDKFRKTKGLPRDWVFTTFTKRMQQIMAHCFLAVKSKLECKLGYFDLIGCDFLIDENFKVWLLEMNSNPALHTNCEVLKEVIPGVVVETLGEPLWRSPLHTFRALNPWPQPQAQISTNPGPPT